MKHKTNPNKEETGLRKKMRRSKQRMGFFLKRKPLKNARNF